MDFLKEKPVGENESFVTLLQVARDNPEIKNQLVAILSQTGFNRKSILNSYLDELRYKRAPDDLISALSCLLDDNIAKKALEILKVKP